MLNADSPRPVQPATGRRPCPDAATAASGIDYFESVVLADGRPARLFPLRKEHAAQLLEGFARLSDRSRYMRFFTGRRWLSDDDLGRLLALDGCDQFAIAVQVHTLSGWEGAAVGRLVRVADAPDAAELAITVLDDYHRLGIGRLLLARLQNAAAERGFARLHGEVLAENRSMLRLLRDALPTHVSTQHGPVVEVEAALSPTVDGSVRADS